MYLERGDVDERSLPPSWPEVVLNAVATAFASLDAILAGMVVAGLGVDALIVYLGLSRTALFDRIAALGLPTPHDRPMRRAGGKSPWTPDDVRQLIALWTAGVHVRSIAESLGRSRSAIYGKRRRLGLPVRDRNSLHYRSVGECRAAAARWASTRAEESDISSNRGAAPSVLAAEMYSAEPGPAPAQAVLSQQLNLWAPEGETIEARRASTLLPTTVICRNETSPETIDARAPAWPLFSELTLWQPPVAPAKKRKTDRVRLSTRNLTAPEKIEIENRGLAGQRPTSIAREMGVTFGQVTSYLRRAMVARFRAAHDIELVEYYDPAVAEANIRRLRLARTDIVVAEKRFGSFWAKRGSGEKWPEWFKKTKAFIDAAMVC